MGSSSLSPSLDVAIDDGVAVLTLVRPEQRNPLTPELLADLRATAARLGADEDVRCAIVAARGPVFAAGADLHEIRSSDAAGNLAYNRDIIGALDAVERLPVPTIAAIDGHALGGGLELALACTMRVAARGVRLGLPEVHLGLLPGAGGTARLPRLVGPGAAARLLVTGTPVDADAALAIGLVDAIAEPGEALDQARMIAADVAAAAPLAVRALVRLLREGRDRPSRDTIDAAHGALAPLLDSADLQEGLTAFLERRPPRFQGI